MAQPQQQHRGAPAHGTGAHHRSAGRQLRLLAAQRPLRHKFRQLHHQRVRARQQLGAVSAGQGGGTAHHAFQPLGLQPFPQSPSLRRNLRQIKAPAAVLGARQGQPQPGAGLHQQPGDRLLISQGFLALAPFRQHILRFEAPLGKDRLALAGVLLGALPLLIERRFPTSHRHHWWHPRSADQAQVQPQLLHRFPKHVGKHRLGDRIHVAGHWHAHPQLLADQLLLVEDHRQHPRIHRVAAVWVLAGSMQHQGPHDRLGLGKAIHASLALFVAGRVPAEVVVHHRIEAALQVDPF